MKNTYRLLLTLVLIVLPRLGVGDAASARPQKVMTVKQVSKLSEHLRRRFGFALPVSAKIVNVAVTPNNTMFVCVEMPVPAAVRFKTALIALRRAETQRFLYEDKDSFSKIGSLPAGNEPASVEAWQKKREFNGAETMIYIQNVKRIGEDELKSMSYLVMFSQESRGLAYFYFNPAKL